MITLEDDRADAELRKAETPWDRYPAVEALIEIGNPSIRAMLAKLEATDDEHVRNLSARVIYHVEGPELSKIVVQLAIAQQNDPKKKKRLEAALPLLKSGE
jgi:HEAT repeat protein